MGMSSDISPRIVALSPTGGITYILETTSNTQLGQVQLAVPVTEVLVIDQGKGLSISDSPIIVADIPAESINWLANNVIVLVSQPQEIVVVDSSVPDVDTARQWYGDSATASSAMSALSQFLNNVLEQSSSDSDTIVMDGDDEESQVDVQEAKTWVQDSAISSAALISLKSYLQDQSTSKS